MALPAIADKPADCSKADACITQVADANVAIIKQVSEKVSVQPSTAAEIVKQAILDAKASDELVLQIVKAAVVAAPEQAEAVHKVAAALAPDAEAEIEVVIASVLQGDQVADASKPNAGDEPEGDEPGKNDVFLTNKGIHKDGATGKGFNGLATKVHGTVFSNNKHHNTGGMSHSGGHGGGTVVVIPVTPNGK